MSLETDDSFDRKISFPRTDKILSQSSNFETDNSTALKQIDDNENQTVPVKDYLHLMKKYNDLQGNLLQLKSTNTSKENSFSILSNSSASHKSEIRELKDKIIQDQKLVTYLKKVVNFYESRCQTPLPSELKDEQSFFTFMATNDKDPQISTLKAEFEAEKERITQKHQEELRNSQQKINQLLSQLRKEQNKSKEENHKLRSYMRNLGDETPSKTSIVYSKEYVDELKQTIASLQNKGPVSITQVESDNYQTEESSARFNVLQMKYNQSLNRIKELEKQGVSKNPYKPDHSDAAIEQYTKEIDRLREKLRFYEHQEIPKMTKRLNEAEEKMTNLEKSRSGKKSFLADSSDEESDNLKLRLKELQKSESEYKAKCIEMSNIIGSIRKECEERVKKIKSLAVMKIKQVLTNIQMFRAELNHISSNLNYFGELVWGGADKLLTSSIYKYLEELNLESFTMKTKYLKELRERKKLYNQLQEMRGNIRVFCRVRPLAKAEKENVVKFPSEYEISIRDPTTETIKTFDYDYVFPMSSTQSDVFQEIKPMICSVLDGYNVCIFAYGQTGSGKTYTMEGPENDRGVYYRAVEEMFKSIKERTQNYEYNLEISLMEIYNEQIRDLFCSQNKKLEIKQGQNGAYVQDLTWIEVTNYYEVERYLDSGSKIRAVAATNLNEHSSRSHLIYSIKITGRNILENQVFTSKLNLIDLAGSERLSKSKVTGEQQKESIFINKSLSAFSDVIAARLNNNSHIPFRNSQLTHLLQDSLSGDSKVLMILQINPSMNSVDENLNSLKFGSRVHCVELGNQTLKQLTQRKKK